MPASPFFSIVIPTYNRADFIAATLQSVLDQTEPSFEVLVVDDGSKDNTAEVVRRFTTDPRVSYWAKTNGERGAARNYGLSRSAGEYVIFLDSDDLLHPNHLATLRQGIEALNRPNFIATKYDFDRNGQRHPSDTANLPAGPLGFDDFIRGNALACNVCVRRQNPRLHRFEEDRRYAAVEDWMFMLQNTQQDAVQLLDAVTVTMNDHDQRSMRADNQGLIRRLDLAAGWMQQHLQLSEEQRRRLLGRVYYLCAIHAYADGHRAQALRYTRQAAVGLPAKTVAMLLLRTLLGPRVVGMLKG
ncbi:hypothetical protein GCM10027048_26540 [Hymenobacter coalescens]